MTTGEPDAAQKQGDRGTVPDTAGESAERAPHVPLFAGSDAGRTSIVPTDQEYAESRAQLLDIFAKQYVVTALDRPTVPMKSVTRATEGLHGKLIDAIIESGWENAEHMALREWAFEQLDRIINAVRGEPGPLSQHSLHDVAERVEKAMAERTSLDAQLHGRGEGYRS